MNEPLPPCYETIASFVNYLEQKGLLKSLALSDEDIADVLWLALQMREKKAQPEEQLVVTSKDPQPPSAQKTSKVDDSKLPRKPSTDLYTEDSVSKTEEIKPKNEGLPFPTPAAPALLNKLAISRALRPLMLKVPSPTRKFLDVEASVTRIAEQDIWVPVTQPEPERWLDLELVVEETRSSFIWQETIAELEALLHNHGAFRRVRTWSLWNPETRDSSDSKKHPKLTRRTKSSHSNSCEYSYRELIASNRRSLIILLSDCVSSIWQQKSIYQWLKTWSEQVPTTIMQLFPERLWLSSELGFGYKVKFSAFNPGVSNSQLICYEDFETKLILNLPVITLEPEYIKSWTRVVAGCGSSQTTGIVLDLDFVFAQIKNYTPSQRQNLSSEKPETIVDQFLATASPTAQKLAGLMAAAPVNLSVVHLIQKTLLPNSTPVHIAEVFLSGMIERKDLHPPNISPLFNRSKGKYSYDFVAGVRKLLNRAMSLGDTEKVLDVVSEYIAENLGLSIKSFTALLFRRQDLSKEQQEQVLPFAYVTMEVLRNLGGEYAEFADFFEEANIKPDPKNNEDYQRIKHYWLVQANPKLYRMVDSIRDFQDMMWPVTRYQKDISVGDGVLVWLSGLEAGIYAIAEISEIDVTEEYRDNDYYIDKNRIEKQKKSPHIRFRYLTKLLAHPLLKKQLILDEILKNLSVILTPRNSIFKVTPQQWNRVYDLISLDTPPVIDYKQSETLQTDQFETVTVNRQGEIIKTETKQAQYFTEILPNNVTLEMVAIPGGTFMMGGSPEGEGDDDERPQHQVTVQPFFMGKYPVTQAQWKAIASNTDLKIERDLDPDPSRFKGDNRPVERVSWLDAVEFCLRLSKLTGKPYRPPTEAEWEYACRAGTTTPFYFGETITSKLANYEGIRTYADEPKGEDRNETTPVGQFPPNAFGLYDLHGNVWEWCFDDWHDNYEGAPADSAPWIKDPYTQYLWDNLDSEWLNNANIEISKENRQLLRGGSWVDIPSDCRCAYRNHYTRYSLDYDIGFRVLCRVGKTP